LHDRFDQSIDVRRRVDGIEPDLVVGIERELGVAPVGPPTHAGSIRPENGRGPETLGLRASSLMVAAGSEPATSGSIQLG